MDGLLQDLRYGLRALRKNPRFTGVAAATLAIGIAAATVVFSVVYGILLAPLPYRDFDRAVTFFVRNVERPDNSIHYLPISEFETFRQQNHTFDSVIGYYECDVRYEGASATERWSGACGTADSLSFFGVAPAFGRLFTDSDAQPGASPVFVISDRLWRSEFNADPGIIGKTFVLNDRPRTLVGIMPPRFAALGDAAVYLPLNLTPGAEGSTFFGKQASLRTVGRLRPGVSVEAAAADLDVIAHRIDAENHKYPERFSMEVERIADVVHGPYRAALVALFCAVLLLLLIACSNVANLLLVRATVRRNELAIRASLGASPARLVRQLFVESFLLAVLAGTSGCALAAAGMKAARFLLAGEAIPGDLSIGLSPAVLLFAFGITVLAPLLCGTAPALQTVRGNIISNLKGATTTGTSKETRRFRSSLVVCEVALCILLLAGSGLMLRTVLALTHVDLGFDPTHIAFAQLAIPVGRYDRGDQKAMLLRPVLERIHELPGVSAATESVSWPPSSWGDGTAASIGQAKGTTKIELVSEGYFRTLDMRLLLGRLLTEAEADSGRHVAVVNEAFARNFAGARDPVGQMVRLQGFDRIPSQPPNAPHSANFEIVGVVSNYRNDGLREPAGPQVYIPYTVTGVALNRTIMVRTSGDPKPLVKSIAGAVRAVDADVALADSGTIESELDRWYYQRPRLEMRVLSVFASLGLLLVAIAVFSVMAFMVSLQTREIGIRMALGAGPATVVRAIVKSGMGMVIAGILLGLAACAGVMRLLENQIWGVSANDPMTLVAAAAIVVMAGLAACVVPAARAAKVDPILALRQD